MEDVELGVAPPAATAAAAAAAEQEHAQARRKTPADLYYDTRNRQSSKNVLCTLNAAKEKGDARQERRREIREGKGRRESSTKKGE